MAFALRCIASECRRLAVSGAEVDEITDLLWGLVESEDLDEWYQRVCNCACLTVLVDASDGVGPRKDESASWPEHLRWMVYEAYELGIWELYAGVSGVSEGTLGLALRIVRRAMDAGGSVPTFADLPALTPFVESIVVGLPAPDPWGPERPRTDFGAEQAKTLPRPTR